MKEDRNLTFLESILTSAATGAVCGSLCGVGNIPDENREIFTDLAIDFTLQKAQEIKKKDRKGYFPGIK